MRGWGSLDRKAGGEDAGEQGTASGGRGVGWLSSRERGHWEQEAGRPAWASLSPMPLVCEREGQEAMSRDCGGWRVLYGCQRG